MSNRQDAVFEKLRSATTTSATAVRRQPRRVNAMRRPRRAAAVVGAKAGFMATTTARATCQLIGLPDRASTLQQLHKESTMSRASQRAEALIKDTADVRQKLWEIWRLVEKKEMSASEARFHISRARAVLKTLKVEIAAAHQDPHSQG